ncbi:MULTISPECIES: cytochrome P450 [unclassified Streptomyces]|uniref:cytochrome P450 n=1 Tax=unclassified Streptomyces TaxID=2593676 RepID=UPI002DD7F4EF|nr:MULTISPECIES: cytochrome P450 [unclassified Streptomyces]WSA90490.1 cytochrome P450 [Streptomyces sp. NBC_01795]WSB74815.1 cytochrome P450 [Streptomyces sp. NBC_01775]WSS16902.1 cytochrome P450 [Streptomyces sp. NBC_01186]WSS45645.1 cytochrome P450 [Streptomyces sp. NBC_01187]
MTNTMAIPTVDGSRLTGSMNALRRDPLGTYLRARRDHGDVVRFAAGPPGLRQEIFAVFSAEGAQQLLARSVGFRKEDSFYDEIRTLFGNGLLTSQDDDYLRQRRFIQPLFTRRKVNLYAATMCEEVLRMLARWRDPDHGRSTIDIAHEMTRLTQRITMRVLFGGASKEAGEVVDRCFPILGTYMLKRAFAPLSIPRSWPTPANRRAMSARRELYGVCDRIIRERGAMDSDNDLLGLLLNADDATGDRFSSEEVRDQVLVFFLAGHETTATAMKFALHLLARSPEVQARARDEVDRVLGSRPPAVEDFDRLEYVQMVLKEAMRLYPSAPGITRRATAETEVSGYLIPAGATVFLSPWVTHRHPAYWKDPGVFAPERFLPEEEAERPRYAWFPFGGGPRACIGQYFGMLESVLAVAAALQKFELEAVDTEVRLVQKMLLQTEGPVRCRVTPR